MINLLNIYIFLVVCILVLIIIYFLKIYYKQFLYFKNIKIYEIKKLFYSENNNNFNNEFLSLDDIFQKIEEILKKDEDNFLFVLNICSFLKLNYLQVDKIYENVFNNEDLKIKKNEYYNYYINSFLFYEKSLNKFNQAKELLNLGKITELKFVEIELIYLKAENHYFEKKNKFDELYVNDLIELFNKKFLEEEKFLFGFVKLLKNNIFEEDLLSFIEKEKIYFNKRNDKIKIDLRFAVISRELKVLKNNKRINEIENYKKKIDEKK